mmetsp:Transcript_17624/g.32668  ORF Transcript_17624/g.32668 Transcript_17624/m.32668 type:complete len:234 (-) Transcript_17624:49-750(-)
MNFGNCIETDVSRPVATPWRNEKMSMHSPSHAICLYAEIDGQKLHTARPSTQKKIRAPSMTASYSTALCLLEVLLLCHRPVVTKPQRVEEERDTNEMPSHAHHDPPVCHKHEVIELPNRIEEICKPALWHDNAAIVIASRAIVESAKSAKESHPRRLSPLLSWITDGLNDLRFCWRREELINVESRRCSRGACCCCHRWCFGICRSGHSPAKSEASECATEHHNGKQTSEKKN